MGPPVKPEENFFGDDMMRVQKVHDMIIKKQFSLGLTQGSTGIWLNF